MPPKTIIVGGGVGAIAMAHTLKCKLGYTNFEVRLQGVCILKFTTPDICLNRSTTSEKAWEEPGRQTPILDGELAISHTTGKHLAYEKQNVAAPMCLSTSTLSAST